MGTRAHLTLKHTSKAASMASVERSTNLYTLGKETAHMAGWEESAKRWSMMSPLVLSSLRGSTTHYLGVWASFAAGVAATSWGLVNMHLDHERKAFLGMGFTFMTASAFTLAKTMRDLQEANSVKYLVEGGIIKTEGGPEVGETIVSSIGGSAGWVLHSWLAFGASISLTAWGLLNLPIADERKVFLATSGLLLLTSTMNLVKAVRDRIDARRLSALLRTSSTCSTCRRRARRGTGKWTRSSRSTGRPAPSRPSSTSVGWQKHVIIWEEGPKRPLGTWKTFAVESLGLRVA